MPLLSSPCLRDKYGLILANIKTFPQYPEGVSFGGVCCGRWLKLFEISKADCYQEEVNSVFIASFWFESFNIKIPCSEI